MKYVYNAERDRLACSVWNPSFILAVFEDEVSKDKRAIMLHSCTDNEKHLRTLAEKYANEEEILVKVRSVSRSNYEKWLCGDDMIKVSGTDIPASFVTDYLIAEDIPSAGNKTERYGDLSKKRELLLNKDANLLQSIAESFEKASEKYDIVREEEEPENDRTHECVLEN